MYYLFYTLILFANYFVAYFFANAVSQEWHWLVLKKLCKWYNSTLTLVFCILSAGFKNFQQTSNSRRVQRRVPEHLGQSAEERREARLSALGWKVSHFFCFFTFKLSSIGRVWRYFAWITEPDKVWLPSFLCLLLGSFNILSFLSCKTGVV